MIVWIENAIEWSNDNDGATMAMLTAAMTFLTFVYVIATLVIVGFHISR